MNIQAVIVAIIIAAAMAYIGRLIWGKTKTFSSKSGCDAGCGCSGSVKQKK